MLHTENFIEQFKKKLMSLSHQSEIEDDAELFSQEDYDEKEEEKKVKRHLNKFKKPTFLTKFY